jgi:hypothetical protein
MQSAWRAGDDILRAGNLKTQLQLAAALGVGWLRSPDEE